MGDISIYIVTAITTVAIIIITVLIIRIQRIKERYQSQIDSAEGKFVKLFHNMHDGIVLLNDEGNVMLCNNSFEKMLGYPLEELKKLKQEDVEIDPHSYEDVDKVNHQLNTRGYSDIFYREMRGKSGETIPIEARMYIVQENGMRQSWFICRDISARIKAETAFKEANAALEEKVHERTQKLKASLENLKTTQRQLVESEKMASLARLVAGVAHEINTPVGNSITAVSFLESYSQDVIQQFEDKSLTSSTLEDYLTKNKQASSSILHSLKKASNLIRIFKEVSIDQRQKEKETFFVKDYLREIQLSLRGRIKDKQYSIIIECPPSIVMHSYPKALIQIFTNLIMNSLTHGFTHTGEGKIVIAAHEEDDSIMFIYNDNGRGMSPQTLQNIYEPFYTGAREKGCIGLGMHIVYNIVTQQLKGTINVNSAIDEGITVTIKAPK